MIQRWRSPQLGLLVAAAAICASYAHSQENERVVSSPDRIACASPDPAKSVPACTRIIQDKSWSSDNRAIALRNRGFAYQSQGDLNRAIADYNEVIKLGSIATPNPFVLAKTLVNRGIAYARKGDDTHALGDYDAAIGLDPKIAIAYLNRADAALRRGDNVHALRRPE